MATFRLFVPKQAVGANLVYFDLFNASTSGMQVEVLSVRPVVSGAVAVTGTLGVDLFLTRTTAVGTGGTAATRAGTDTTAMTITCVNGDELINDDITARLTPSGGATAGAVLSWNCVFSEETSAATYVSNIDLAREIGTPSIIVRRGSGLRVVQGAVASVGNIGFNVLFNTIQA